MENSRTKNVSYTAIAGTFRSILGLIVAFVSRTAFIYFLGAEYLSLNGLFSNILSILSLAELGIGSAITFYLYKPIAERDNEKIKSLLNFYKKSYMFVGTFIIIIGFCIVPFLRYLVKFESNLDVNLYVIYILFLLNSGCSYFANAYKQSFLQANQMGYKIENVNSWFLVINCIMDVFVLWICKNFIVYLCSRLILVIAKNLYIGYRVDMLFPFIKEKAIPLQKKEYSLFFKDMYNVLIFNLGDRLLNATDNIIISAILGTIYVGYYSNYFMIITQVKTFYSLLINSFRAGVGNVIASDYEKKYNLYKEISLLNQIISIIATVGMFQIFNSVINIWIGNVDPNYILSQEVVTMVCLAFYYDMSTGIINLFREGAGGFKTGRYTALITGGVNIALSILLAQKYELLGVFLATVLSKYIFGAIPFVISVGNNVFEGRGKEFLLDYYKNLFVLCLTILGAWSLCKPFHQKSLPMLVAEIIVCGFYLIFVILIVYGRKKEFRILLKRISLMIKNH